MAKKIIKTCEVNSTIAVCKTCGMTFDNHKNAQANAARHAKEKGNISKGEQVMTFEYKGVTE